MPFKLRLKKSKHYNVVSKTLFVICVELLDSTTVECTLSSESTGQECRDNVCQRLGLQQPELFGLRFATKPSNMHPSHRWAELSRPLKRQLDKYSQEPNSLQLRVMYYVSGLGLLTDEMTRYHYFLQLKCDVIEGRVSCSPKQAALLASYSMQAEFGDHEPGKHTAQYLKDFALFPAHLTQEGLIGTLTEAVILQHCALRGLSQGVAEEYYILAGQQLEGYGQQSFAARDEQGNEVVLGVCLTSLYVAQSKGHYYRTYRWEDIANVVNVKRGLTIEGQGDMETTHLTLASTDLAKYVWRLCLHQHTFFVQNEQPTVPAPSQWYAPHYQQVIAAVNEEELLASGHRPSMHGHAHISSSVPELLFTPDCSSLGRRPQRFDRAHSNRDVSQNENLRALLPQYRPAPDYETAMKQKYQQVATLGEGGYQQLLYSSQPEIPTSTLREASNPAFQHTYYAEDSGAAVGHFVTNDHHGIQTVHTYSSPDLQAISDSQQLLTGLRLLQLFKQPPPYTSISSSTPDLANVLAHHNPPISSALAAHVSGSSPDLLNSRLGRPVLSQVYQEGHEYARTLAAAGHHQGQAAGNLVYYHQAAHHMAPTQAEPIYENFPLRYSEENLAMRARTSSIQSAPENLPQSNDVSSESSSKSLHVPAKAAVSSVSTSSVQHLPPVPPGGHSQTNTATKQRRKVWSALLGGKGSSSKGSKSSLASAAPEKAPGEQLSVATSKDSLCQRLEKKLTDSQLFLEFEHIPRRKEGEPCTCALSPENLARNRYKDVICYDYNRVQLTPRKDNKHGYINASHVVLGNGPSERRYVAAQAPTGETLDSYWQMVWETGAHLVVSLAARHEESHCPGPPDTGTAIYGEVQVQSRLSQETGHCVTSRLHLLHRPTKSSRSIWLLRYCEWGDQGTPYDEAHFLGFLEELSSVRQHAQQDSTGPPWPTIVHCLAGAGRTGLLIMADVVKAELESNQDPDLSGLLLQLRCQRMLAVQTILQYRFIHSLVVHYLRTSRLI